MNMSIICKKKTKKLKKNMNKFQILTRIVKHKLFLGKKVGQNMWDSQHMNV